MYNLYNVNDMNVVKNELARMGRLVTAANSAHAAERNAHAVTAKRLEAERSAHEATLAELANLKKQFSLN
jgi:hypothetical protein